MSAKGLFALITLLFLCPGQTNLGQEGPPAKAGFPAELDEKTKVAVEALTRLKGIDLEGNAALKGAVLKVVEATRGKPQVVELIRDFKLRGKGQELIEFAAAQPAHNLAAEAMRILFEQGETGLLDKELRGANAPALLQALGNCADSKALPLILPCIEDEMASILLRKQAVQAAAKYEQGAKKLLELAQAQKLPEELRLTAALALSQARWAEVKQVARELLPLPQTAGGTEPLPPLSELAARKGDPAKGAQVFRRPEVNCIGCHQINGEGTDFGPKLSEIGTKLGKEALYEAILDPNAGISFGYEGWQVDLKNGDELFGIVTSETADDLSIKAQTGVVTTIKKADIARRQQSKLSIMPSGLHQAMSVADFGDLVEYLASLKKAQAGP